MSWYWWGLIIFAIYIVGFVLTMALHMTQMQMVTPPLALLRSALWPLWWTTGKPHGSPLDMD